jgi:hypothetical protein
MRSEDTDFHELLGRITIPYTDTHLATIDVLGTLAIAAVFSLFTGIDFILTSFILVVAGIITHKFMSIQTPLSKLLEIP